MTPLQAVSVTLVAVALYLATGMGFAVWFALHGAGRLDPAAARGTRGFRLLVLPGATLLWPVLAARLRRGGPTPPVEHNAHRDAARRARARP